MDISHKFHCCATCKQFNIEKLSTGHVYQCVRLGYETKPAYRFNCWDPKDNISRIIRLSSE